ncbi:MULTISPECIES: GntR family transcriptional regulator [unclassified Vibrio]|uniref:GntR family transcriptional regulator n=1 Tax=Vibrio sp. HB236076 TaxID=3232307 RepID=A0AB39HKI3_9VIBR|nr:GntR family transcriptional regulator [Vibrio sp. HB161653]MDP5252884.1 GntR family transcriptional regulator [Vibrio sp. HB161653]
MARLPMYRQIADAIRERISDGIYEVGTALPTEAQLREDFACSRVTVRQALKLLIENGELESVQGSGTYVKEQKVNYDIYQQSSFAEKWAHLNADIHSDVLTFEVVKATLSLAELLNVQENEVLYHVIRVRYLDKKPITVEETWLPTSLFPDLTYQVMQGSKYHYIEKTKGLTIDRSEQEIIPVLPPADIADLLHIDPGQPIIEKRNRGFLNGDVVFEYSRNYFKTTDYKFTLVAKRHKR